MKLPDLATTLEDVGITHRALATRLHIDDDEAQEIIRGEATGEITLGQLREAYAMLGKAVLMVVVDPMTLGQQEETREECWRRLQTIRHHARPPLTHEAQLNLLRSGYVRARMQYRAPKKLRGTR